MNNVTAPRAVSYQIVRRRVGSNNSPLSYQLFRSEVRPFRDVADPDRRSTFEQGYDLFGDNGYNDPDNANTGNTTLADPGTIRRPRSESLLGNGVIDFGTRIFTMSDTGVLEEAFPVDRRGGASATRLVFAATTDDNKEHPTTALASDVNITSANTSYGYPAVVEVMVRILTPEGIEIMQAFEEDPTRYGGYTSEKWWELAEANSRVFTRRIEIRSTVN